MWTLLAIFFLQFANKAGSDEVCLSPTAIEMREERGIAIDSLDYAVSPMYLDSVKHLGAKVLHSSRWMNGATVEANDKTIEAIEQCGFVDTIYLTRLDDDSTASQSISLRKRVARSATEAQSATEARSATEAMGQLGVLNLLALHQAGYKGQGIRIGVADGGFYHADSLICLPRGQWLGYADLTDDREDFFGRTGSHGSLCLTSIVAQTDDYEGAASQAEYFLFRTEEQYTESPKEIDNWVAAIEMADSLGLHIVSTSLGYTTFDDEQLDWAYADMDGRSTRGAQAAVIAARKGMLLVTAMGNEGNKRWHYLSTPADADSILSVGAVNHDREIASFSSYGPTADGRVKPEVCAVGEGASLINPANGEVTRSNGTSFACPQIAGMAACLWSALPHATNMEIREMIIRSCDRYDEPHEQYGYGIPDVWKAYTNANTGVENTTSLEGACGKIMKNGELYIIRQGSRYNLLGHKIE